MVIRNKKWGTMSWQKFELMSLRQRIVRLTSGTVFVIGLLLVIFVNLIAPIFITSEIGSPDTQILIDTIDEKGNLITILAETPGPDGATIWHDMGLTRADPLMVVCISSGISLIIIAGFGFIAARIVASESLKPIVQVSNLAREISIQNFNRRLNYQGEDDELKALADSFDHMLDRLQMNFEEQSVFISNLAHELRTPLTSVRLNLEVLKSNSDVKCEDYIEFSNIVGLSLKRLERMVEDFLLLAKGEKEIDQCPIILGVLFEDVLDELAPIAEKEEVGLEIDGNLELEIIGDPVLLNRALANLIENGIYYNHRGGFVRIYAHKKDNLIIIEILDNGIGIAEEQQSHIFKRFYRGASTITNHNGTGLGLAIAAQIITLHNGRIDVKSELGKGSEFRITLPPAY
jgi:signal transduction histidine kinase